ncbi:Serpentine receptor class r-10 [Caenorhabditis elegans]|uniref:Serpentine receptor class r-10 n=1 Tax=Caenorhabditis elegans TaxID=6239 RepID=Q9N2T4_CAEEL|nr:Seven TM Receptor [Caenorhabditis elegans]CCD68693.1 Seven TM Receptor [Caenorhabditis elegans]|eukprot:NP_500675.2 Seven TM Receptor [Caenorhabditis elegans]
MGIFLLLKSFIQSFAIFVLLITNILIIFLVKTKSPTKMGSYKHLLCYFSCLSMVYGVLEYFIEPYIFSDAVSGVLIMDLRGSAFELYPKISLFLIVGGTSCFGVTIYAIAINFIYRYFAIQRQGRLRYFSGKRIIFWIFISLLGGIISSSLFLTLGPNDEMTEHLRINLSKLYNLDVDRISYIGLLFWTTRSGNLHLRLEDLLKYFALKGFMMIPFCIIIYCGVMSYLKIKNLNSQGESEFSKRLQVQLYKALIAQFLIPMLFLFLPTSTFISCPLFKLDISWMNRIITILYSFYFALDPFPIIYLVDEYRKAVLGFFRYIRRNHQVSSVIMNVSNLE